MGARRGKTVKLIYVEPVLYDKLKLFAFANGLAISEFLEIVIECLEKRDYSFFEKMKRQGGQDVGSNTEIKEGDSDRA